MLESWLGLQGLLLLIISPFCEGQLLHVWLKFGENANLNYPSGHVLDFKDHMQQPQIECTKKADYMIYTDGANIQYILPCVLSR